LIDCDVSTSLSVISEGKTLNSGLKSKNKNVCIQYQYGQPSEIKLISATVRFLENSLVCRKVFPEVPNFECALFYSLAKLFEIRESVFDFGHFV